MSVGKTKIREICFILLELFTLTIVKMMSFSEIEQFQRNQSITISFQ